MLHQLWQIRCLVPTDTLRSVLTCLDSGLWQQSAGRSSSLHGPSTPVGSNRGCDVSSPLIRPHHRRPCVCQSESSIRLPFWSTKSCVDLRQNTLVHSAMSPTCLAANLYSAGTGSLAVPLVKLTTVANGVFPVVGTRTWNEIPDNVTSAELLSTFYQ